MRVRCFVEFDIEEDVADAAGVPGGITDEMYTKAAKECVQDAMDRAYNEGSSHSLSYCCAIGEALVFGARIVHNNCDNASAAKALSNAVECRLREDELKKAKLATESLLRSIADSDIDVLELNQAYATLDNLVYPLTGQHVNTNMEEPHE